MINFKFLDNLNGSSLTEYNFKKNKKLEFFDLTKEYSLDYKLIKYLI